MRCFSFPATRSLLGLSPRGQGMYPNRPYVILSLLGVNTVSRYIGSQDSTYSSLFLHESWRELLETAEPGKSEVNELVSRIMQYLNCPAENMLHLPVAEAMVTYKERRFVQFCSQIAKILDDFDWTSFFCMVQLR